MQRNLAAFAALIVIFIVAVSLVATIKPSVDSFSSASAVSASGGPFYLGVTYGGDSVAEAKQLIDKVKGFTNLFVLQSGSLMNDFDATEQICDYAVKSGLNIMLYYGTIDYIDAKCYQLVNLAQQRWSSHFLGLYFNDEPGGKALDKENGAYPGEPIYRNPDGSVVIITSIEGNSTQMTFYPSGEAELVQSSFFSGGFTYFYVPLPGTQPQEPQNITRDPNKLVETARTLHYMPNGTIIYTIENTYGENTDPHYETIGPFTYLPDGIVQDQSGRVVTDQGNISQFLSYQEVWDLNPFGSPTQAADHFESYRQSYISDVRGHSNTTMFTSDYALYWFDYKAGYDTVFAQFVGNESRERHIALCRGAAETLGKDWGAIITWKYNQMPYLESGDELYNDLTLAYSSGAKYGIVFTYPNITAYGTLTDEHFEALQRFWNTIHTDPASLGRTESDVAYVVPADYGFGFRSANDTLWGQFGTDELSAKIYSDTVTLTGRYGAKLNILYDGPEIASKLSGYSTVFYYNQTVT